MSNVKHQPKTSLPEIDVNINGDLGVKEYRRDPANGITQRFTLDEKREVARRANAYPKLVAAMRYAVNRLDADKSQPQVAADMAVLLAALGEAGSDPT